MPIFKVTVANGVKGEYGHHCQSYEIRSEAHHDTAILAAQEGLKTYQSHGHTRFPHSRGPITLTVEEIEEEDVDG